MDKDVKELQSKLQKAELDLLTLHSLVASVKSDTKGIWSVFIGSIFVLLLTAIFLVNIMITPIRTDLNIISGKLDKLSDIRKERDKELGQLVGEFETLKQVVKDIKDEQQRRTKRVYRNEEVKEK